MYTYYILCVCFYISFLTSIHAQQCDQRQWTGVVKYHNVTNDLTACGIRPMMDDTMYAALRDTDYDSDRLCNTCIKVIAGQNSVVVKIMDKSGAHGLDIHKKMFSKLGDTSLGSLDVTWSIVPCPVKGNIGYYYSPDSYPGEKKIEVVNNRNGIKKLFFRNTGSSSFKEIFRASGNPNDFFVMTYADDYGSGPFDFMVEDLYGNVVTDYTISFEADKTFNGSNQFPICNLTTEISSSSSVNKLTLLNFENGFMICGNENKQVDIIIFDIQGKIHYNKKITTNTFFNPDDLLIPGIYIIEFDHYKAKFIYQ